MTYGSGAAQRSARYDCEQLGRPGLETVDVVDEFDHAAFYASLTMLLLYEARHGHATEPLHQLRLNHGMRADSHCQWPRSLQMKIVIDFFLERTSIMYLNGSMVTTACYELEESRLSHF